MYNWLKIGALIALGRFLKPRVKGLIALVVFWLIISFLHDEYENYVELSGNTDYLVTAALTKIALYLIGFALYVLIVERKILKRTATQIQAQQIQERPSGEDDGFDFLREKHKLQNQADKLLDK